MFNNKTFKSLCFLIIPFLAACSKMDEYKDKYITNNSEITYAAKVDSLKVLSGNMRVVLTAYYRPDPKVTTCRIYWDTKSDSITVPVVHTDGKDTLRQVITGLSEGRHSFEVVTFDQDGNRSVTVSGSGVVYGDRYASGLIDRPIVTAELKSDGNAYVEWSDFDTTSGAKQTQIKFFNSSNVEQIVSTPVSQTTSTLTAYKAGTLISYRTMYIPDTTAVDTFYTAWSTKSVKADVTSVYLSNTGPNFTSSAVSGRWGTLGAPWITNAGAKNKSGVGGYSTDDGGTICWETWGNTPVIDGRIYQTTSAPLPAGSYTISFTEYSEVQSNSSVYCVVAEGSGGIPSAANLSSALAYVAGYSGANVGTTSPSSNTTKTVTFTLSTAQYISFGWVANIVGSGDPGSYYKVWKIQLFSL